MRKIIIYILLAVLMPLGVHAFIGHYTTKDGLPTNEVWQITQLPNKQILVQTAGTFSIFNGRNFEMVPCAEECAHKLPIFANYGMLTQGDTLLWLRDFYNIYLLDTRTNSFRTDAGKRLEDKSLHDFAANKKGTPHFNKERYQPVIDELPCKDNIHPTSACIDHEGGVWIATINDGVYYWSRPKARSRGIAIPGINSIAAASDHELVIGRDNDILLFDTKTRRVLKTIAAGSGLCHDVSVDHDNTVWISTNRGLYRYKRGETTLFDQSNTSGFVHSSIRFAKPIGGGRLLVCNLDNVLGYFYPEKKMFVSLYGQLPVLRQYRVLIGCEKMGGTSGRYLIYTQNGKFMIDTRTDKVVGKQVFSEKYNCVYIDSRHRLWQGTPNGLVLQGKNERTFGRRDGLENTCVKSLAEDAYGNIWIGTAMGVSKLTMREHDTCIVNYSATEGMPSTMMVERGSVKMPSGEIWMADKDGLTEIFPAAFQKKGKPQTVVITSVGTETHAINVNGTTSLEYDNNSISVSFSTLNYSAARETRYRYRLCGLDDKWTVTASIGMGTAVYRYLEPGRYTFEVEAAYDNGMWGPPAIKEIEIEPPLWLTWYAKTFYALAVVMLMSLAMRQYLRRKARKMEKDNDERVNRLFEMRSEARHQFAKNTNVSPEKLTVNEAEQKLMGKLLEAIETNMGNTEYTVDQMASDVCLSRSNLYRRMQAMLGITPNDFLRSVRLKRAAKLLAETTMTVSEVSAAVGFSSSRYFSQYFKKMFGVTPTEYAARGKEK